MATYQGWAHDPVPYIPSIVDEAQVYWQNTPVDLAKAGLVNFWGRVPLAAVRRDVQYANLTGPGISHSGDFDVRDWYWKNIVPLLGDGPAFLNPGLLTAAPAEPGAGGWTYSGRPRPGPRSRSSPSSRARTLRRDRPDLGRRPGRLVARRRLGLAGRRPLLRPLRRRRLPRARRTFVMHTVRIFEAGI